MEVLIVIVVLVLLIGIFKRTGNRTRNAWFTRPCPNCRQTIDSKATVCPWCTRDVPPIEPGRFEPIKRLVAVVLVLVIGYAFVTQQAPREKPPEKLQKTSLSGVAGQTPAPASAPETKVSTSTSTPETKASTAQSTKEGPAAQSTEQGQSVCYEVEKYINALVDYTQTSCIPARGKAGASSFTILSSAPVFSVEASK